MLADLNALLEKALTSSVKLRCIMGEKFPVCTLRAAGTGDMLVLWTKVLSAPTKSISLCIEQNEKERSYRVLLCWEPTPRNSCRMVVLYQHFDEIPESLYGLFTQYKDEPALVRAIVRRLHHAVD